MSRSSTDSSGLRWGTGWRRRVLEILVLLVAASYAREKGDLLRRANVRLERLRYPVRLAKDLRLLSLQQYEFASWAMQAMIGGWRKSQARR